MLVAPDDPKAMAQAIGRIAAMNNTDWRAMSDIAHQTAMSYTWEDATTQFEASVVEGTVTDGHARLRFP